MYTVQVVGLVYFNACEDCDKMMLLPNGTNDPQFHHQASIFIEPGQYKADTWWKGQKFEHTVKIDDGKGKKVDARVLEFRIPQPAKIVFPVDADDAFDSGNIDQLPKLKDIYPQFELDLKNAKTIARAPLPGGKLHAFSFGDFPVAQWTIANKSATISIKAVVNGKSKSLTLKSGGGALGTEIVFSNTESLFDPEPGAGELGHFRLYALLGKNPRAAARSLIGPTMLNPKLTPLPFTSTYLKFAENFTNERKKLSLTAFPATECGPTCC
jgi:hypothetical protein